MGEENFSSHFVMVMERKGNTGCVRAASQGSEQARPRYDGHTIGSHWICPPMRFVKEACSNIAGALYICLLLIFDCYVNQHGREQKERTEDGICCYWVCCFAVFAVRKTDWVFIGVGVGNVCGKFKDCVFFLLFNTQAIKDILKPT